MLLLCVTSPVMLLFLVSEKKKPRQKQVPKCIMESVVREDVGLKYLDTRMISIDILMRCGGVVIHACIQWKLKVFIHACIQWKLKVIGIHSCLYSMEVFYCLF